MDREEHIEHIRSTTFHTQAGATYFVDILERLSFYGYKPDEIDAIEKLCLSHPFSGSLLEAIEDMARKSYYETLLDEFRKRDMVRRWLE